jgi:hypothetical protein
MSRFLVGTCLALALLSPLDRAQALPEFAHDYGFSCQKCHSVVPQLNSFGQAFLQNGYWIPTLPADRVFPVSVRFNFAYSGDRDPSGLPKVVLDELELLSAGSLSDRLSYFYEQYVIDGGEPGSVRDGWLSFRLFGVGEHRAPVSVEFGQFTLPLPVDPETFRDTTAHYAVFDQTVGDNAFNFFDPKNGIQLRAGSAVLGSSVDFALLSGHDKQSGLPAAGTDTMLYVQDATGPFTASSYTYSGERRFGPIPDRFERQGFGLSLYFGKIALDNVIQHGFDSSADGHGAGTASSGGFSQLRYNFSVRSYGIVRIDGTQDTDGFNRSATVLFGRRLSHNTRFTIEDVITHAPLTTNTLNTQLTIAF